MTAPQPPDLKARIVYAGLFIIFIAKFGKFVVLEVWDAVGPLFSPGAG